MSKSRDAFRTISEVAEWLETPAHVLRFWESKFTQIKPVKRAGGRRYYRPADMELLGGIKKLLHDDGMTIKGVQKVLREQGVRHVSSLNAHSVDEDGLADETIEDAPFIEAEVPDSVVNFPGGAEPGPAPETLDMFADASDTAEAEPAPLSHVAPEHDATEALPEAASEPVLEQDSEADQDPVESIEPPQDVAKIVTDAQAESPPEQRDIAPEIMPEPAEAQAESVAAPAENMGDANVTESETAAEPALDTEPEPVVLEAELGDPEPDSTVLTETETANETIAQEDTTAPAPVAELAADTAPVSEPVPEPVTDPVTGPENNAKDPESAAEPEITETETGVDAPPEHAEEQPLVPRPALLTLLSRVSRLSPEQAAALAPQLAALKEVSERQNKT